MAYAMALVCAVGIIVVVLAQRSARYPQITIEAPEGRVSPVLKGVCSVFMRIRNEGDGDDDLIEARVDIPGAVTEIHDVEDGKMRRREKIHIPSGSIIVLRPLSYHIMSFKMPADMKEGYGFDLYLGFAKSGERKVTVKIRT